MFANLSAEAGLSECSQAGTECPGFGVGPPEIAIVGILAIALLMVPASATVSIFSWKPPARERMSWLVAVWVIPVVLAEFCGSFMRGLARPRHMKFEHSTDQREIPSRRHSEAADTDRTPAVSCGQHRPRDGRRL